MIRSLLTSGNDRTSIVLWPKLIFPPDTAVHKFKSPLLQNWKFWTRLKLTENWRGWRKDRQSMQNSRQGFGSCCPSSADCARRFQPEWTGTGGGRESVTSTVFMYGCISTYIITTWSNWVKDFQSRILAFCWVFGDHPITSCRVVRPCPCPGELLMKSNQLYLWINSNWCTKEKQEPEEGLKFI